MQKYGFSKMVINIAPVMEKIKNVIADPNYAPKILKKTDIAIVGYFGKNKMNKYHSQKIVSPDGKFDSKYEYEEWCRLKLLEKGRCISNLRRQVPFLLIPTIRTQFETLKSISYCADFVYEEDGKNIILETKGFKTKDYQLKKRLLIEKYVLSGHYVFIERNKKNQIIYKV